MSDPFERAKGGRLTFKDGTLATRSKAIDKKKKKKKKKQQLQEQHMNPNDDPQVVAEDGSAEAAAAVEGTGGGTETYTIDAAKRMKYEQLFPVEAKKFGYDPKSVERKTVEDVLDDRVKKKADRYCK
ncbi:hypothetical protein ACFX2I_015932 [Malus domestica]|uniref:uncharacterized protein LOC126599217 n=1 Tax=Malus sylvestris TaxID=3752 RepID=UPI0021ACBCEC|nr:uncharacterized protein LOC126599217 [Malus sylvestris]